jgi:hypothetical protein
MKRCARTVLVRLPLLGAIAGRDWSPRVRYRDARQELAAEAALRGRKTACSGDAWQRVRSSAAQPRLTTARGAVMQARTERRSRVLCGKLEAHIGDGVARGRPRPHEPCECGNDWRQVSPDKRRMA